MKLTAATIAVVITLLAGACSSSEPSPAPLPAYTPTPTDLYKAYSAALNDLEAVLDDLLKVRHTALAMVEAAPEVALNAVRESGGCDVHVDDLVNDPIPVLSGIMGIPSGPQLQAVRGVPLTVAHDLAAAHIASPANRAAVESASDAYFRAKLTDKPVPEDPVFAAYLGYLEKAPVVAYSVTLKRVTTAYLPISDNLSVAWSNFYTGLRLAPEFADCRVALFALYEDYIVAYELNLPALHAYFDGIRGAIEDYADALERDRESYVQR